MGSEPRALLSLGDRWDRWPLFLSCCVKSPCALLRDKLHMCPQGEWVTWLMPLLKAHLVRILLEVVFLIDRLGRNSKKTKGHSNWVSPWPTSQSSEKENRARVLLVCSNCCLGEREREGLQAPTQPLHQANGRVRKAEKVSSRHEPVFPRCPGLHPFHRLVTVFCRLPEPPGSWGTQNPQPGGDGQWSADSLLPPCLDPGVRRRP